MPTVGKIEAEDPEQNQAKSLLSCGANILLRKKKKVN